jgi:hypothetical protein
MLTHIVYRPTNAGSLYLQEQGQICRLLGAKTLNAGLMEVSAQGKIPYLGEGLVFPLKGAKQLSFLGSVLEVTAQIQPADSWLAKVAVPVFDALQIRTAQVCCDQCGSPAQVEFVSEENADVSAALLHALQHAGWRANLALQICPICARKEA